MDKIHDELIDRGVPKHIAYSLRTLLSAESYDTDAIQGDITIENHSQIHHIVNNKLIFNHVVDIIDDHLNGYDDNSNDDNNNNHGKYKCESLFEFDTAIYSYYVDMGKSASVYYDLKGYGKFNKKYIGNMEFRWTNDRIENEFHKDVDDNKLTQFDDKEFPLNSNIDPNEQKKKKIGSANE
eukprot:521797_1